MEMPFKVPGISIPGLEGLLGEQFLTGTTALIGGLVLGLVIGFLIGWYKYYWRHRHRWGLIESEETKHY